MGEDELNLTRYVLRRLAISVPTLLVATFACFLLVAAAGDPLAEARSRPGANQAAIAVLAHELRLDEGVVPRYFHWLGAFLSGDWGSSIALEPVFDKVTSAYGVTFGLVIGAEVLALVTGVLVGVVAAVRRYRLADHLATALAFLLFAMPVFCIALLLKDLAVQINGWVRELGLTGLLGNPWIRTSSPESTDARGFGDFVVKYIGAYLLPTLSIMAVSFAGYSRFQRASMLETLNTDYVRTARAKGISPARVVFRHAFRNALIPVATLFSVNFGVVISGAVITERVFNWNGMGSVLVDAVNADDPYLLMGWIVLIGATVVVANLVADVFYGVLDPRIRVG
ncbi:Putative peptide transport permease protein [Amycolatopsis sp. CA-230715]|nr:Putative peptide transport permease protein [Amycolatopsis sp. CA-230715]